MNRKEHVALGIGAGLLTLLFAARRQRRDPRLDELVGACLFGALESRRPDILEPPLHPGHRAVGHRVVALGVVSVATTRAMSKLESAPNSGDANEQFLRDLVSIAKVALPAGFASHLGADATTPAGSPLVGLGE